MRALGVIVLLAAVGCSKKESGPAERKDPWRASAPEAAVERRTRFVAEPRCQAAVELPAREATPRGAFRVCRGELDLDLADLEKTRGTLSIDLGSIEMRGGGDAGRSDEFTQAAQNWLDIGQSRPEAERERLRWATFTLDSISELSAPAAHAGKLTQRPEPPSAEPAPPGEDGGGARGELRSVSLVAKGALSLHAVRVDVSLPLAASFHYAGKASASESPTKVVIETRRPLVVGLGLYDIKPRDAAGTVLALEMKTIGAKVGAEAKVSIAVSLGPAGAR